MRKPRSITAAQVVSFIFILRCIARVIAAIAGGHAQLIYGKVLGPFWIDAVLIIAVTVCIVKASNPKPWGIVFAAFPLLLWLSLTIASPENFTAWHWLPDGGPREPWGIPRDYSYQFRYQSHQALVATCIATVVIELSLTLVLVAMLTNAHVRAFYGFSFRSRRQPNSA